jgi:hypothetical protein
MEVAGCQESLVRVRCTGKGLVASSDCIENNMQHETAEKRGESAGSNGGGTWDCLI